VRVLSTVLLVVKEILIDEIFKKLVLNFVSLPTYVNFVNNLFYNVAFKLFFKLIYLVCVHSIDHVMYCTVLMFKWLARVAGCNGISQYRFPV